MSFKASRGRWSNGRVRASRPISCSSDIFAPALRAPVSRSGKQLVPTRVGDEQARVRGIGFDLLTQAIDMRLERMRRYVGIVAPDLFQQGLARDDLTIGASQEPQDRRLFLGQAQPVALGADQVLGSRTERIGADLEFGVL